MTAGPQHISTIIFDLDGTLIDSLTDIGEAANQALETKGFPVHPTRAYRHFVGDGLLTLVKRAVPPGTSDIRINEIADLFRDNYKKNWSTHSRPYPGINEMVEVLSRQPLNLAVLSNKPDDFTQLFVRRFFSDHLFGRVIGNQPGMPKKPNPAPALAIADHFGVNPTSCLLVGDSNVDMKTGNAAGMTSIGVTWGFRSRQELEDSGARLIIDHPSELLDHVLFAH